MTFARDAVQKQLERYASIREGLFVEVAGGASWLAPNAVIDNATLSRWSTWLTVSYQMPQVSIVGVVRYLNSGSAPADDTFDIGARVMLTRSAYALSVEYVDRHLIAGSGAPRPWRLAGIVDYRINETLWLTGSFGRDYQSEGAGSLIAQLGVSFQFSQDRASLGQP